MKAAVLGAGVSGLAAARRLYDAGVDVTVYEQASKPGGLARTRITEGYVYDPHGGHILNSKHSEVMDWVFGILPKENWQFTVRNAKIFFKGSYVSYPFELSLCELPIDDAVDCAYDFILAQQGEEPKNYSDWLVWMFGQSIADKYMLPYNRKIWAYPLEQMGTQWMQGKMPLPDKKEILRSLAMKDNSERKMPHSTFYYPLYGGIQTMVDAIAKPLRMKLDTPVKAIDRDGKLWRINGEGSYDVVISTIPLPVLPTVMTLPVQVESAIKGLKYNSLTTALVDCPKTDITWMYIPGSEYRSHRIGYQSALTPYAVPNGGGAGAFEIIGERIDVDDSLINKSIPDDLQIGRLMDSEFTEYAYVIHDLGYQKNVKVTRDYFDGSQGMYSIGRWGSWNYNNMDLCMYEAFRLTDKITGSVK